MSAFEITEDVIPAGVLDLLGLLSDEAWGDGHCEEGLSLESAAGERGYTLLVLMIAAYNYLIEPQGDDAAVNFRDAFNEVIELAGRG